MPKVIQPRRHDKSLSVDQYWGIRDQQKAAVAPVPTPAFREEEIASRYRFQKPSDQAKSFNPLAYFLRTHRTHSKDELYRMVEEEEDTHIAKHLAENHGQLSPPLAEIKRWAAGRSSTLHNQVKILRLLCENLQLEDAWPLLQALLKDCKGAGFHDWVSFALQEIAEYVSGSAGSTFSQTLFSNLFDTLCILMQTSFEAIKTDLQAYFQVYAANFLKHNNKYIRKFTLQSFSYVLSNLSDQEYQDFMQFLDRLQSEGFFDQQLPLADILVQRLSYAKGCLTAASLGLLLTQLENFQTASKTGDQTALNELICDYVFLVLKGLSTKSTGGSESILFDLNYVLEVLFKVATKDPHFYCSAFLKGLAKFVCLYETEPKRFEPKTPREDVSMKTTWAKLGGFYSQNSHHLVNCEEVDFSLAVITTQSEECLLYSKEIMDYYSSRPEAVTVLVRFLHARGIELPQKATQILLLLSRDRLKGYFLGSADAQESVTIYSLLILLKRSNFSHLIESSYLSLTLPLIQAKITSVRSNAQLFLVLRVLTFIKLQVTPDFLSFLVQTQKSSLAVYEGFISTLSGHQTVADWLASGPRPEQFYEWRRFGRQIIMYSHHQIPWVREAFNLFESFNLLFEHLGSPFSSSSLNWNQLLVNRPSAMRFLVNRRQQNLELIQWFVSSRNRQVRHLSLSLFRGCIQQELQTLDRQAPDHQLVELLDTLLAIDQDEITLDNERQVKRLFCKLEEKLAVFGDEATQRKQIVFEHLVRWSIGFAFTGFKLIHQSFLSFFSKVTAYPIVGTHSLPVIAQVLLPFLCYYNYRHSRQYDFDLAEDSSHVNKRFKSQGSAVFELAREDLEIKDLETVQWIGLQRIAESIRLSPEAKSCIKDCLNALVTAYFEVEFKRQEKVVKEAQVHPQSALLLPIKSRFLGVILKLCPKSFLPPPRCLHFLREQFFEVAKIREIKRHAWELLWEKEAKKGNGQKNERTKSSVNLSHLSAPQRELYLNYLWKQLLESSHHRKRNILEHIRNELQDAAPGVIGLFFESLHLGDITALSPPTVTKRLLLLNRKVLLGHMFILKSILVHLRNQLLESGFLQAVLLFLLSLVEVIYSSDTEQQGFLEEDRESADIERQEQGEPSEEIDKEDEPGSIQTYMYKQHRKQLQKLLETLFVHHELPAESVSELLEYLLQRTRIDLTKATRSSVPGLLHVLLVVSHQKIYCEVLLRVAQGRIMRMMAAMMARDASGQYPLVACRSIWLQIMENIMIPSEEEEVRSHQLQAKINELIQPSATPLLEGLLSALLAPAQQAKGKNAKQSQVSEHYRLLRVADLLMQLPRCQLGEQWSSYLWKQLSSQAKAKNKLGNAQHQRLSLLLKIIGRYLQGQPSKQSQFLRKTVVILPYLKDLQHREEIIQTITKHHAQLGLGKPVVDLAAKLGSLSRQGLEITLNFAHFFQAVSDFATLSPSLSALEHQYFLHHLLSFADHDELPIRKAVYQSLRVFLEETRSRIAQDALGESRVCAELVVKLFRVLLDFIQKVQVQENEPIFWNVVDNLELIFSWLARNSSELRPLVSDCLECYAWLAHTDEQSGYLRLLVSISESSKLKALKQLKAVIQGLSQPQRTAIRDWKQGSFDLPNPVHKLILPILVYFVTRPHKKQEQQAKSNLASSLALSSLELLPFVSCILKPSAVRNELKRLTSKLRYSEAHSKSNIATIRMIGQILEGVPGETATSQLHAFIQQHGFENFHQRLVQHHSSPTEEQPEQEEEDRPLSKVKVPDYYDHLQELEEEEAIRRNFLSFDKKLMEFEQEEPEEDEFCLFLKRHILPPLRTLLMTESKGKEEEDTSRNKILLSVTTIKVILRLPLEAFLREFQKVIGKLSRLLKKRETQVRQYSRSCLCQISKAVGPQLLYSIVTTMKFHLKDNFDRHVFNYTVHRILEGMPLRPGDIDYCLPLLLPMVMDEVYGRTAAEKQMVSRGEAPTLKTEAKKKKGLELLQLLFRYLSHSQINFVIDFLQKYLCEHLISEENMGKYDQLLGSLSSGLAANPEVMDIEHSSTLLQALSSPVASLRQHLRWLLRENSSGHERLAGRQWERKKVGKEESLSLQEEAGRNRSIFARLSSEISQKKNKEIVTSALVQFYLTVISLLVRKNILTLKSVATESQAEQLTNLLAFLVDCIDHRDNRLVSKSLKILHLTLNWKAEEVQASLRSRIASLRKQANRKVLGLAERLTLADEELLRQCFVFLNDLVGEAAVNAEMLPSFVALIKLHTPTTQDQPHIPETYKLLRTLLYKAPLHIYSPLVSDLRRLVRLQVASDQSKDIRELSKSILSIYIKERPALQANIEAFNLEAKRHGWPLVRYEAQVKEELVFCLSNLECRGQAAILELLGEWADCRSRPELEQYSELIILSLMTARTNQLIGEAELNNQFLNSEHPADCLVRTIIEKIDQSKLNSLAEKALHWMGSPRSSSVRLCGSSLMTILINDLTAKQKLSKLGATYLSGSLSAIASILAEEVAAHEQQLTFERSHGRMQPKWNDILNQMQNESAPYLCDLSVYEALRQFNTLSGVQAVRGQVNESVLIAVWKLLGHNNHQIVSEAIRACLHHRLLPIVKGHMSQEDSSAVKGLYAPRKIISKLLFSTVAQEGVQQLLRKLLEDEELLQQVGSTTRQLAQLLIGLSLKAHIKPKIYESTLPRVLSLINEVLLATDLAGTPIRSVLCQENQFCQKLLELSLKLGSNQLISYESKALALQTGEILKEELGNEEYFRLVGQFEESKRERRTQEKVRRAELKMLDPEAMAAEGRTKKRKAQ